jgi:hypothetical protein
MASKKWLKIGKKMYGQSAFHKSGYLVLKMGNICSEN